MTKESFKKYNEHLAEQSIAPLANPRSAASGSLRMKDPMIVRKRNLEGILYHISYVSGQLSTVNSELTTHSGNLEMLWQLGFKSPVKEKKVLSGIDEVINFCKEFEITRDN